MLYSSIIKRETGLGRQPEDIDKELPALLQPIQAQSEQLSLFEKEASSSKLSASPIGSTEGKNDGNPTPT